MKLNWAVGVQGSQGRKRTFCGVLSLGLVQCMRVYAPDRRFESDGTVGDDTEHVVAAALRQPYYIVYVRRRSVLHDVCACTLYKVTRYRLFLVLGAARGPGARRGGRGLP